MEQPSPQTQNLKVQKWVALVSVILLAIKFTAFYYTNSISILTDAMESIVNVIAGFIGLYSLYIAAQPKDINHPYGHGKAEFLSAGVEGVLIGIAGIFILYEAVKKLFFPLEIQNTDFGMLLIGATAVINYLMGSLCVAQGKKNHSLALEASGRHLQTDTYSTLAVVLGLVILHFTHLIWIDAFVAILLSLFILYTSYNITRRSVAGIMDEADTNLLTKMVALINNNRSENWVDIHNLRVIKFGSILHVDAHLTLPWYFNVKEAHKEVDDFSAIIRKEYGNALELFVHSDGCIEGDQCPICIKSDCPFRQRSFSKKIEWALQNVVENKKHDKRTAV